MHYIFIAFIFLFISCSGTKFLKKDDYYQSYNALENNQAQKALQKLPKSTERNTFITSMEKTYLSLISGKPDIEDLINYSKDLDERVRFSVSRELKTFFYLETPEGYYASEHELILLHMFLSWGYSIKGEYEKAYVEAKKSSNLLGKHWSAEGRFDDPFLRVFQAVLWQLCGHWDEARVDLRAAYHMDKNLRWAIKLSEQQEAPEEIIFLLGGPGHEPKWDPSISYNPLRGMRNVRFEGKGKKSILILQSQSQKHEFHILPASLPWYERHLKRDNEIHELIRDSNYGQLAFATGVKNTFVVILGTTTGIIGIATGVGIIGASIYYAAELKESALLGIALGITLIKVSAEFIGDTFDYAVDDTKEKLDTSSDYRFVRFLPEYGWLGWRKKNSEPLILFKSNPYLKKTIPIKTLNTGNKKVIIDFYADTH
ncbi:MAG: hypothetical protein H7A25_09545 [Leptospiraceae bacterium]|nr:hypothetical protein [Leptospiraceae bacterium]